ncbi:DUF6415 family natural product biosynthesis protein [Streptomyces sp. NPDC005236]|uniref:DUF6415 family natural product biosynthesis protein n=1 Tax=Streptomyces sp. NPDC005236 TaxID=3157028 RepID=UPI0033B2B6F6
MASATVSELARAVRVWTPPLDPEALETVLTKVRGWQPFDGESLLDDVIPAVEDLDDHDLRLRAHLMQLAVIAAATEARQRDPETERLIRWACQLRAEAMPSGHLQAVGYLRQMAWSVNELHERLGAIKFLREAA